MSFSPPGAGEGAIFDLGYAPHDGDRLGRQGAFIATVKDGVRRILGIRRKTKKKIMPWILFSMALLPVAVVVGLSFFTSVLAGGAQDVENPFGGHPNLFTLTNTIFLLFCALAGPELLIPDREEGVLSVYASRPMRAVDYLAARAAALGIAAGGFLVVPQLILYVGLATLDADGWFAGLRANLDEVPKFLAASFVYLLGYGAPAFLVGLFAKRLGPAWGVYLAGMTLLTSFAVAISSATAGIGRFASLAAIAVHPDIVMDEIFGRTTIREGLSSAELSPWWSLGVVLLVTAVTTAIAIRKYRKLL